MDILGNVLLGNVGLDILDLTCTTWLHIVAGHLHPFVATMSLNVSGLFQLDNASSHTAKNGSGMVWETKTSRRWLGLLVLRISICVMCWTNKSEAWNLTLQFSGLIQHTFRGLVKFLDALMGQSCFGGPRGTNTIFGFNVIADQCSISINTAVVMLYVLFFFHLFYMLDTMYTTA